MPKTIDFEPFLGEEPSPQSIEDFNAGYTQAIEGEPKFKPGDHFLSRKMYSRSSDKPAFELYQKYGTSLDISRARVVQVYESSGELAAKRELVRQLKKIQWSDEDLKWITKFWADRGGAHFDNRAVDITGLNDKSSKSALNFLKNVSMDVAAEFGGRMTYFNPEPDHIHIEFRTGHA